MKITNIVNSWEKKDEFTTARGVFTVGAGEVLILFYDFISKKVLVNAFCIQ